MKKAYLNLYEKGNGDKWDWDESKWNWQDAATSN